MNTPVWLRPCAISFLLAGCNGDLDLPPAVASSEYLAYHTDADSSIICMDDFLMRQDRFIEQTAVLLGVEVPSKTIDFMWDPVPKRSDPWACPPNRDGCYQHRAEDELEVVVSPRLANHHELVHAVEIQALGSGHQTLEEGLAEYLGTSYSPSFAPDNFPGAFKAMLAKSPNPSDYGLAMHFVGSIFARHGAEKYRELRARMPKTAGLQEFAEVFEAEYGQRLDDALIEMSNQKVYSIDMFFGCGEGEANELTWTSKGLIDTMIESSCGDPWFYGGGFTDGQAGFYGLYAVDVLEAGYYDLTVTGIADGPVPLRAFVTGCSFALLESAVASFDGQTGRRILQAGRHTVVIAFPERSEAKGDAAFRLEYISPPP